MDLHYNPITRNNTTDTIRESTATSSYLTPSDHSFNNNPTSTTTSKNMSLNTQQGEKNNLLRLSPRRPRNMKNLSLDLSTPLSAAATTHTLPDQGLEKPPTLRSRSGSSSLPFRHPSLSIHRNTISTNDDFQKPQGLQRRRTTLALTIPCKNNKKDELDSSVPKQLDPFNSSPISASPVIPSTPDDFQSFAARGKDDFRQQQSLSHSINGLNLTDDFTPESFRTGAYQDGPVCVFEPNLYLYSEPTLEQIKSFDIVINVAKELNDYTDIIQKDDSIKTNYIFVPWTHTSQLCQDFIKLVPIIENGLSQNSKILIHCQCGVSRSASLIIAFIMKNQNLNLNDAYNELKLKAPLISPNMTLIFQLMEWNNILNGKSSSNVSTPTSTVDSNSNSLSLFVPQSNRDLVSSPTLSEVMN